jgi:hypothetical protein
MMQKMDQLQQSMLELKLEVSEFYLKRNIFDDMLYFFTKLIKSQLTTEKKEQQFTGTL